MDIWNIEKYQEIFSQAYLTDEANFEEALMLLKKNGATQVDCVKVLIFELRIPLKKADELVLNSKTWSDHKEQTLKLRDTFEQAIEQTKKPNEKD